MSSSGTTAFIQTGKESREGLAIYLSNRGIAYSQLGQYDRANADFDQAIKLDPRIASFYFARGNAWAFKSDLDRALSDLDRVIQLDPKDPMIYGNRGTALLEKGELNRATTQFLPNIVSQVAPLQT
jgi:tetratricopeptide (TPR) repeat protein